MTVKQAEPQPTTTRLGVVVATLGLAAFLAVLDGTAVTASLPAVADDLGGRLSAVVWMTTAYLVAAGVTMPLVGWLSDRYGGRATYLAGLGVFLAGSLLVGVAWDLPSLIAFRVLQGLGGGLLEPAALALAAALAPRERVGAVMGRFSLVINLGPIIGPLVGALLADGGSWRWIFLLNLPLGLLLVVASLRLVPAVATPRTGARADLRGIGLLITGFVLLLLTATSARTAGPLLLVATGALGAVLLGGYVAHARRATAPVLDLRLLRTRGFGAALAVMAVVGFTMYAQLTVLPVFAEQRFGLEGLARGAIVAALGAGLIVSMSTSGRLSDAWGPRRLVVGGAATTVVAFAVFVLVAHDGWPLPAVLALFVVVGLGFGCVASPTFASVYRILPEGASAQGTTALFIAVQLAAAAGATAVAVIAGASEDPAGVVYAVLCGAIASAAAVGTRLAGRPAPVPTAA